MSRPQVVHRVTGKAFHVQVERHAEEPRFRISVQPAQSAEWVQLQLLDCRGSAAQDAIELSRALHLCAVMVGHLVSGGTVEHWSDAAVRHWPV
jgi:hypothetical protein